MNRRLLALLLAALTLLGLLSGCGAPADSRITAAAEETLALISDTAQPSETQAEPEASEPEAQAEPEASEPEAQAEPEASEPEAQAQEVPAQAQTVEPSIEADGTYTAPEDVAAYLHQYGTLPENFITKAEARALGWDNSRGNLWDVAPGKSIGGDRFGNYEGLLPDTTKYRECDVNYTGGYRGAERLIYGEDGSIYYTDDHYNTFTRLY